MTEDAVQTMTVNETIQRLPASIGVFNALGIDACCGGAATLAEAAAREGIPVPRLLQALREAAAEGR